MPNFGCLLVNAMEPKAKHAVHASAFFVVYDAKQKFLNKSVTSTGMFKLLH